MEEILRRNWKRPIVIGQYGLKETIVVCAWYIWWQRREYVKAESIAPVSSTTFSIRALTANYGKASSTLGQSQTEPKWVKPPFDHYKLNVDASFYPNGSGEVAAVFRNRRGEAVAGESWMLKHMMSAVTAESIAIKKGLDLVERLGCKRITVESDSLEVIKACRGLIEIWSPYTAILADIFQKAFSILD